MIILSLKSFISCVLDIEQVKVFYQLLVILFPLNGNGGYLLLELYLPVDTQDRGMPLTTALPLPLGLDP